MADPTCAHCGTAITDRSTMVDRGGQTYCCNNCAMAATGNQSAMPSGSQVAQNGGTTCAHCGTPIFDTSTEATRGNQAFCCNNCATAGATGAGRGTGHGGTSR